jgi:dipeptidyl aminopeptidase/acylaminoacyl peptidase
MMWAGVAVGLLLLCCGGGIGLPMWMISSATAVSAAAREPFPVQTAVIPAFSDAVAWQELEPGIEICEVNLPGGFQPGHSGKLWLYRPAGTAAERSLSCVFVAPAGTTLLHGSTLGEIGEYHEEHTPYVRAGMAVVAFELDGDATYNETPEDDQRVFRQFAVAQAGLVNARVALEYALAKFPQVDPARLYVAGHSSAGTLALLFAAHEPRLRGCAAYAPCSNLTEHFGGGLAIAALSGLLGPELRDFVVRSSPDTHVARINCPVLVFQAQDDSVVPETQSAAFVELMQAAGKTVEYSTVATGEHYDSMITDGIPQGIAFFRRLEGGP